MTEDEQIKAVKASHNAIDEAVSRHCADLGIEGFVTGWTLTASIASVDAEVEYDGLYSTQSDGLNKWHLIGLLNMALKGATEDGYVRD